MQAKTARSRTVADRRPFESHRRRELVEHPAPERSRREPHVPRAARPTTRRLARSRRAFALAGDRYVPRAAACAGTTRTPRRTEARRDEASAPTTLRAP